jgi:uncharacterized membrane protein YgdD (TMEM256/DUF423 family)
MSRLNWVRVGALLGFLGVALGAFGAHGLKGRLDSLGTAAAYQTAVEYHMVHALALLAVGLLVNPSHRNPPLAVAGWSFLAGVTLFSGSLYLLSVTGVRALGAVTPFGGVAMLVGWLAFAVAASHPILPSSGLMSVRREGQPESLAYFDTQDGGQP